MEMNPVASRVSQGLREKILRGFEAWLDGAVAGEESPKGIAPELLAGLENGRLLRPIEGHCDLYSLWSAMTALTQEIKLQSRTSKQVNETLEQMRVAMQVDSFYARAREQEQEEESSAEQPTGRLVRKEQVDLLLALRDRLERGISSLP